MHGLEAGCCIDHRLGAHGKHEASAGKREAKTFFWLSVVHTDCVLSVYVMRFGANFLWKSFLAFDLL